MTRRRRRTTELVLALAKRWDEKGRKLLAIGQTGTTGAGEMARNCARELASLIAKRRSLH